MVTDRMQPRPRCRVCGAAKNLSDVRLCRMEERDESFLVCTECYHEAPEGKLKPVREVAS